MSDVQCIVNCGTSERRAGAHRKCKYIGKLHLYSVGERSNRRPRNCGVTRVSSVRAKITCQRQEILGERLSEKVAPPLLFPSPSSLRRCVRISFVVARMQPVPLMRCKFMCVRSNVRSGAFLFPRSRDRIRPAPFFLRNLYGRGIVNAVAAPFPRPHVEALRRNEVDAARYRRNFRSKNADCTRVAVLKTF